MENILSLFLCACMHALLQRTVVLDIVVLFWRLDVCLCLCMHRWFGPVFKVDALSE